MASGIPEGLQTSTQYPELAEGQPERMAPLLQYLVDGVRSKVERLEDAGKVIEVLDPDWSRDNPEEAGRMHAEVIVGAYGTTYALPNKDPEANRKAIETGELDVYFMRLNGELTGTTCMVNVGDGRAELGRSASIGRSGNSIIQDMRIIDWLINSETAQKYHTLFTTLRSAPDRIIDDEKGYFVMRGGQAITEHWRKFPGLVVGGFAPLYKKHGKLEQFTYASLSRNQLDPTSPLYLADPENAKFVGGWHDHYRLPHPRGIGHPVQGAPGFEAHYPPPESGLTPLVHADVVASDGANAQPLEACLAEIEAAGSPFAQIVMPIDRDTRDLQADLRNGGYQTFGYQPASERTSPALLYGKVSMGTEVVPTHWSDGGQPNPFWRHDHLHETAEAVARKW